MIPGFSQLGCALAERTLKAGDLVALILRRKDDAWAKFSQQYPDSCMPLSFDPAEKGECYAAIASIVYKWKKVDVVVNYTTKTYNGTIEDVDEADLHSQVRNTFYSAVNTMEAAIPIMESQGFGHIINVIDINGSLATASLGPSCTSMFALKGYSESVGLAVARNGIKVTVVQTPMEVTIITNPKQFSPLSKKYANTITHASRDLMLRSNKFPETSFSDTLYAISHVAGSKDPPLRLVIGADVVEQLKDQLSAVSEDLDEFAENEEDG